MLRGPLAAAPNRVSSIACSDAAKRPRSGSKDHIALKSVDLPESIDRWTAEDRNGVEAIVAWALAQGEGIAAALTLGVRREDGAHAVAAEPSAERTGWGSPWSGWRYVAPRHTVIVPLNAPAARVRPSGLNATLKTGPVPPLSVASGLLPGRRHSCTVPASLPVARIRLWAANTTLLTSPPPAGTWTRGARRGVSL